MTVASLSRLEPVDLRHVWTSEAGDFTPWLAQEENLKLLGETIGIELELEAQEKQVGPFRADILCKDTATGDWVLIENQLERTNHAHLGQLLTYAAGLKAVSIVWIADRFTDEHRAALDWLNEITDDRFNFFALEIEVWKIGDSPVAPKFNVVCKPNDWTETIRGAAKSIEPGELSDTRLLQQRYWTALREILLDRKSVVIPRKPLPQSWTEFTVGRSDFGMHASVNTQKNWIRVGMSCFGKNAKAHYRLIEEDKEAIEEEIGSALEWEELPHRKESRIAVRRWKVDPKNRDDWPNQHLWMAETLEAFHRAFAPRVKKLDANDYQPDEVESQV